MSAKYATHPFEAKARADLDPAKRAQEAMAKVKAREPEAEVILRHLHGYRGVTDGLTPEAFAHDRHLLAAKLQDLAESERFAGFADATREEGVPHLDDPEPAATGPIETRCDECHRFGGHRSVCSRFKGAPCGGCGAHIGQSHKTGCKLRPRA